MRFYDTAFRGADGGEVEFVVGDMVRAVLGSQAEIPRVGPGAEGDDLSLGGGRGSVVGGRGEEGVDEDIEGVCAGVRSFERKLLLAKHRYPGRGKSTGRTYPG